MGNSTNEIFVVTAGVTVQNIIHASRVFTISSTPRTTTSTIATTVITNTTYLLQFLSYNFPLAAYYLLLDIYYTRFTTSFYVLLIVTYYELLRLRVSRRGLGR